MATTTVRSILPGFTLLLICQSVGEALSRLTHIGLPGPVMGMLVLLGLLNVASVRQRVGLVANGLLAHLSLLFVPVGVGVMTHLPLLSQFGWQLLLTLVLSTWIGLLVTATALHVLLKSRAAGVES